MLPVEMFEKLAPLVELAVAEGLLRTLNEYGGTDGEIEELKEWIPSRQHERMVLLHRLLMQIKTQTVDMDRTVVSRGSDGPSLG